MPWSSKAQVTHLSRIDLASGRVEDVSKGDRFDFDLDVSAGGRVVVLGGTDLQPYEISAAEARWPSRR